MTRERMPATDEVPGPFYVKHDECLACFATLKQAPAMMGFYNEGLHCYVRRQPTNDEETYLAMRAIWSSEARAIRYGGDDPELLRRIAELGEADLCDHPVPADVRPVLRNHVTFEVMTSTSSLGTSLGASQNGSLYQAADSFRSYLKAEEGQYLRYEMTSLSKQQDGSILFAFSWAEGYTHELRVAVGEPGTDRLLITHSPQRQAGDTGVSLDLDDWLRFDSRFRLIRWYAAEGWKAGVGEWQK